MSLRPFTAIDLANLRSFGGLDLASTSDLAALVFVGHISGPRYRLLSRFWCPEDNLQALERSSRMPYQMWAEKGFLTATPGNVIDYDFIREEIKSLALKLDVQKIMVDAWNAQQLALKLRDEDGIPIEFLTQGFRSLSAPTKEFKRLIDAKLIEHDGNPVMRWCVSNAIGVMDAMQNVKLDKKKSRQKIDGAAAAVNAIAGILADVDEGPSVYETRGLLST